MDFDNFLENIYSLRDDFIYHFENKTLLSYFIFGENADFPFLQYFFVLIIMVYVFWYYQKSNKEFIQSIREEDVVVKIFSKKEITFDFLDLKSRKKIFLFNFLLGLLPVLIFCIIVDIFIEESPIPLFWIITFFLLSFFSFINFFIFLIFCSVVFYAIFHSIKDKIEFEKMKRINEYLKNDFSHFHENKALNDIKFLAKKLDFSVKKQKEFQKFTKNYSENILQQINLALHVLENVKQAYLKVLEGRASEIKSQKIELEKLQFWQKDIFIKRLEMYEQQLMQLQNSFRKL